MLHLRSLAGSMSHAKLKVIEVGCWLWIAMVGRGQFTYLNWAWSDVVFAVLFRKCINIFCRKTCRPVSPSGPATLGIECWCCQPSSEMWNEAESFRICLPYCSAITRRVVKLPPSLAQSTLYTTGMLGSPGRMK